MTETVADPDELERIKERLDEKYNQAMSVYVFESDGYVRLTNGSAGYYVDIKPIKEHYHLRGERYGENIRKTCPKDLDELEDTLSRTL